MFNDLPLFPLDHLPLFGDASATALKIRDRSFSYEELNLRIGRLAAWLKSQGRKKGDRVATWLAKGEIACIMPLAAARAASACADKSIAQGRAGAAYHGR